MSTQEVLLSHLTFSALLRDIDRLQTARAERTSKPPAGDSIEDPANQPLSVL